jgi:hypothetical protein
MARVRNASALNQATAAYQALTLEEQSRFLDWLRSQPSGLKFIKKYQERAAQDDQVIEQFLELCLFCAKKIPSLEGEVKRLTEIVKKDAARKKAPSQARKDRAEERCWFILGLLPGGSDPRNLSDEDWARIFKQVANQDPQWVKKPDQNGREAQIKTDSLKRDFLKWYQMMIDTQPIIGQIHGGGKLIVLRSRYDPAKECWWEHPVIEDPPVEDTPDRMQELMHEMANEKRFQNLIRAQK